MKKEQLNHLDWELIGAASRKLTGPHAKVLEEASAGPP